MSYNESKKRILFVDDEMLVLNGLKRMLYPMRNKWDMEFAASGKQALVLMKQDPFDIVVSDMLMPEIDGPKLLNTIKKYWPETIRFILSGHCDKKMILETIDSIDHFLTKPCDPFKLKEAISRALDS